MLPSLRCGRYTLPLDTGRPLVMGILNVTPDSFSDGGRYTALEAALTHAEKMIDAGVDILDIGGESTRPSSTPLPLSVELDRVMPVLRALQDCGKPLSIDTYKPEVMRQALVIGVDFINDVQGFRVPGAIDVVRDSPCGVCIMHMLGQPQTMQHHPDYEDVVESVTRFFHERLTTLENAGIARERMSIDPGFGFGKTLDHNLALFRHMGALQTHFDVPLLAGMSRKRMLGDITGAPLNNRLAASLASVLVAAAAGVKIVRVHDVPETVDALKVWQQSHRIEDSIAK